MGQEIGHAFEDLLQIALERIIFEFNQRDKKQVLRLAPYRRLKGVSGNIDHLIEMSNDSAEWIPFLLFMEKHSDSSDNSHLHFRRHLEEYIQAKVASIRHFSFELNEPLKIVNLIYGLELNKGWKPAIINESKRLLHPTIYLPDYEFYEDLLSLITTSVENVGPPYLKEKVKSNLENLIKDDSSFKRFVDLVQKVVTGFPAPKRDQKLWLTKEIERSLLAKQNQDTIRLPAPCYVRKSITQLLLLSPKLQEIAITAVSEARNIEVGGEVSVDEVRELALALGVLDIKTRCNKKSYISLSKELSTLAEFDSIGQITKEAALLFLDPCNERLSANRDYLAYFDMMDLSSAEHIYEIASGFVEYLSKGDERVLAGIVIPRQPCSAAQRFAERSNARIQNIGLETIMAMSSLIVSDLNQTRTDMSTSSIARLSGMTESRINSFRSGGTFTIDSARKVLNAARSFCEGAKNYSKRSCLIAGRRLVGDLGDWLSSSSLTEVAKVPDLLNRSKTMSVSWMRQNQLCSHSIFNPLSVVLLKLADRHVPPQWVGYGFPRSRSANPMDALNINNDLGLDYEFTTVFCSPDRKLSKVFESSSVQGFKHTSDKCKELCARMRCVKAVLAGYCLLEAVLIIDGDWGAEHVADLTAAGWDQVIYIAALLESSGRSS